MSEFVLDAFFEFLECSVHQVLRSRSIYPEIIFENRCKYGISIWQSRHPDINNYINRVLQNTRYLTENDLVSRLLISFYDNTGQVLDQISFNFKFLDHRSYQHLSVSQLHSLEEEFRSLLLSLSLINSKLISFPQDGTWSLCVVTKDIDDDIVIQSEEKDEEKEESLAQIRQLRESMLREALTSNEWLVDNNQLSENIHRHPRHHLEITGEITACRKSGVLPVKSFQNDLLHIEILAHRFQ